MTTTNPDDARPERSAADRFYSKLLDGLRTQFPEAEALVKALDQVVGERLCEVQDAAVAVRGMEEPCTECERGLARLTGFEERLTGFEERLTGFEEQLAWAAGEIQRLALRAVD